MQALGGGVTLETGCVTLGAGSGEVQVWEVGSPQRLWTYDLRCGVWGGGHPRDCGCVTPGAGSGGVTLETVAV